MVGHDDKNVQYNKATYETLSEAMNTENYSEL